MVPNARLPEAHVVGDQRGAGTRGSDPAAARRGLRRDHVAAPERAERADKPQADPATGGARDAADLRYPADARDAADLRCPANAADQNAADQATPAPHQANPTAPHAATGPHAASATAPHLASASVSDPASASGSDQASRRRPIPDDGPRIALDDRPWNVADDRPDRLADAESAPAALDAGHASGGPNLLTHAKSTPAAAGAGHATGGPDSAAIVASGEPATVGGAGQRGVLASRRPARHAARSGHLAARTARLVADRSTRHALAEDSSRLAERSARLAGHSSRLPEHPSRLAERSPRLAGHSARFSGSSSRDALPCREALPTCEALPGRACAEPRADLFWAQRTGPGDLIPVSSMITGSSDSGVAAARGGAGDAAVDVRVGLHSDLISPERAARGAAFGGEQWGVGRGEPVGGLGVEDRSAPSQGLVGVVFGAVGVAVVAMVLLHLWGSGLLDPVTTTVSDYISLPGGSVLLALATLAIAVATARLAVAVRARGASLLYSLGSVGLVASLAFPTNRLGAAVSLDTVLHRYAAGLFFVSLPVAAFLTLRRFPSPIGYWLTLLSVVAGVAFLVSHVPLVLPGFPGAHVVATLIPRGIAERFLFAADLVLLSGLAWRVAR